MEECHALECANFEAAQSVSYLSQPAGCSRSFRGNRKTSKFSLPLETTKNHKCQANSRVCSGETMTAGLRFSLAAGGVTDIEPTVLAKGLPYAQNVPGLIVPSDVITTLFLNHTEEVTRITIEPTEAFTIKASKSPGTYILTPNANAYGHVRITVTYASKQTQSIHYNIVKSGPTVLSDLGNFLATKSYFNDTWDPFNRAPSVISYDNSVSNFVTQDYRVWIAGLSDEAGAGSWLAACMKQAAQPNAKEVARLEAFVLDTLWGTIQVDSGSNMYGVRKSVFYYEKEGFHYDASIQWQPYGESWNKSQAFSTVRAYDYVHVRYPLPQ